MVRAEQLLAEICGDFVAFDVLSVDVGVGAALDAAVEEMGEDVVEIARDDAQRALLAGEEGKASGHGARGDALFEVAGREGGEAGPRAREKVSGVIGFFRT